MMKIAVAATFLLLGLVCAALPVGAHGGHAEIVLLSEDPIAGTYTMNVRVVDFTLSSDFSDPDEDTGHLAYGINGRPCSGPCSGGANWETTDTSFTFMDLKTGDVIQVVLVLGNGTNLDPLVYIQRTVRNVIEPSQRPSLAVNGAAPHPAAPNPGTYTMEIVPARVTLVQPGVAENDRTQGHLRYILNGQACTGDCSNNADSETTSTTFTFYGLTAGDLIGAELLHNDGTPFAPAVRTLQAVANPTLQILTQGPREGDYTMDVLVKSFTLLGSASAGPNNAGAGHIHYTIKHKDTAEFVPAAGNSDTSSTRFEFKDVSEGDTIAAELVSNDHAILSPRVFATQVAAAGEQQDPLAPGVGPLLMVVLLGAALLARSRRA